MSYDAGALIFKIQTAGQETFGSDMARADQAVEKLGRTSAESKTKVEGVGEATDKTSKKAKDAKAPLDEQAKSTRKVGDESDDAAKKQREQAQASQEQIAAAKELSAALLIGGAAVSALVVLSVAKFSEFDEAMAQTRAATMATRAEQEALGEAALEAGADTAYSASEAAAAQEELAKAGQSVADIVGGSLNGALSLAAAGQLQVARSAEIMATTLTQFRLPAREAALVSDVLAAGAGKAQGSVDDLALALSYVGPLAGSVGFALDETAGTIAYFATQGIIGEKAGTSLRGVIASLQAPSMAAAKEMEAYGLNMFDANGEMLSLAGIAEQLRQRLGGLTEQERLAALGRIFGNESLNAATLLYEGGADAVEKWTANVNDTGFAAEQAAMRQDNLAGDVEKLGGAFDTALIRTGSGANDTLRQMTQILTGLVDWYGELPAPIHEGALIVGVATGAMLLFAGAALSGRVKLIELKAALDTANVSMRRTAVVGAAAGLALTGIVTVVGILIAKQAEMNAATSEFADSLDEATGAATSYTRELIAKKLADAGAFEEAKKAGVSQQELTDALYKGGAAYDEVNAKLREAHDAAGFFGAGLGNTINTVSDMNVQLADAKARHQDLEAATDESVDTSATAAETYMSEAESIEAVNDELRELIDSILEANGMNRDAITASNDYANAVAEADEVIRKAREGVDENGDGLADYTLTLDRATQAGRDNTDMLVALAADAEKAAEAQFAVDGSTTDLQRSLEASHQAVMDRAMALGATEDEARQLADTIAGIPPDKAIDIIARTQQASSQLAQFIADAESKIIRIGMTTYSKDGPSGEVRVRDLNTGVVRQAEGGVVKYFANGGVEHHVAQIARAGDWRVWAEPETGGETYVPHAPSKRARSEQIMAETAAMFGGVYIPAGAAQLADGGTIGATAAPAPPVSLDGVVLRLDVDGRQITGVIREEAAGVVKNAFSRRSRG